MTGWIWLAVVFAAFCALCLLLRWMESKGWVSSKPRSGAALVAFDEIVNPAARYVEEARTAIVAEDEDDGDDDGDRPLEDRVSTPKHE